MDLRAALVTLIIDSLHNNGDGVIGCVALVNSKDDEVVIAMSRHDGVCEIEEWNGDECVSRRTLGDKRKCAAVLAANAATRGLQIRAYPVAIEEQETQEVVWAMEGAQA